MSDLNYNSKENTVSKDGIVQATYVKYRSKLVSPNQYKRGKPVNRCIKNANKWSSSERATAHKSWGRACPYYL